MVLEGCLFGNILLWMAAWRDGFGRSGHGAVYYVHMYVPVTVIILTSRLTWNCGGKKFRLRVCAGFRVCGNGTLMGKTFELPPGIPEIRDYFLLLGASGAISDGET